MAINEEEGMSDYFDEESGHSSYLSRGENFIAGVLAIITLLILFYLGGGCN
jgi:hypothetical protein